jgi:hypothetical protein
MKKIDLSQAVSILANIGVIAGIIFLAYELRQNTLATEITAAQNLVTNIGSRNIVVIESDEFAQVLLRAEAGEPLTPSETLRLRLFFADALRGWQSIFVQNQQGALDEAIWQTQLAEMELTINGYASYRSHWERTKDYYSREFVDLIDSLFAE